MQSDTDSLSVCLFQGSLEYIDCAFMISLTKKAGGTLADAIPACCCSIHNSRMLHDSQMLYASKILPDS